MGDKVGEISSEGRVAELKDLVAALSDIEFWASFEEAKGLRPLAKDLREFIKSRL